MTKERTQEIEKLIIDVLEAYRGKSDLYIAYKITKEVIEPIMLEMKDVYERLFYTDVSNKN